MIVSGNYVQLLNFNATMYRGAIGLSSTKNSVVTGYEPPRAISMDRLPQQTISQEAMYAASEYVISLDPSTLLPYRSCVDKDCNTRRVTALTSFETEFQCSKCRAIYKPEGNHYLKHKLSYNEYKICIFSQKRDSG